VASERKLNLCRDPSTARTDAPENGAKKKPGCSGRDDSRAHIARSEGTEDGPPLEVPRKPSSIWDGRRDGENQRAGHLAIWMQREEV